MHALYGAGRLLLYPGTVRRCGPECLFNRMRSKEVAVTPFRDNKGIRPYESHVTS
ncbi:hypothetical protein [uncultured Brevibacillus sp.]|uniref:hypothetical protein n=1 Tax=uncultured Brevibacillus sp. TaxID=169970 RepID=UPI00259853DC|nr:hypothetical protein [uncultured Brevibacillus sp.]